MSTWNEDSRKAEKEINDFIMHSKWENFPDEVRERAVNCVVDLFAVLIAGSKTKMSEGGKALAKKIYQEGTIPIVGMKEKLNLAGAVMSYGYTMNALDIDDGHNIIKGHPGAVIMAGILPAALEVKASYKEFLTAIVIGYEIAIRAGIALHKYYGFYHGTGSWGAIGVAAGISRLYKLESKKISHALSIADYQAPIAPVMRPVQIPSMNKDGIAYGAITGALAVEMAIEGITGEFYNLLEPEFKELIDTLGKEYEINNIYFKYFPCCRWAHAPIKGAMQLSKDGLLLTDIKDINIKTFKAATMLSSSAPILSDEAQYNMVYPVCVALKEGKVTPVEVSEAYIRENPDVVKLMEKVRFSVDEELEAQFPQRRFAKVEITKNNGEVLISSKCCPWGEKEDKIKLEEIRNKFTSTVAHCLKNEYQNELITRFTCENLNLNLEETILFVNENIH